MNEQFEHLADDHEAQMSVVAVYEIHLEGTAGSVADVSSVTCKAILPSRELLRDPNAYELLHIDDKSVTRWRLGR